MTWFFTNFFSAFLLPPLSLLIAALAGLVLWHRRPRIARALLTVSIALLWLFSTPYFAEMLLHQLEKETHAVDSHANTADAIVVLGGGTYFHAPEYGGDTVSETSLLRLRYAAKLYRETAKPILVSGGKPRGNAISEAQQMKQILEQEFNVPVLWQEGESDNTLQSAQMSDAVLKPAGIRRIYLVTHAWHMPRAARTFQSAGFDVVPAPTAFTTRHTTNLLSFIPDVYALRDSRIFIHEIIGIGWYRLKS